MTSVWIFFPWVWIFVRAVQLLTCRALKFPRWLYQLHQLLTNWCHAKEAKRM